ncbi:uncharacterized protein Bfra_006612 [Botrytis fragariae]|uniref:Uncharacterized protein n=1 Tax=Botrytis fragariae TaxID=1964551 RepID=A0A8H6B576_9HELO|nr:uncharacterized protein Bfra_006612 [Botrytis fragariae]KAF5879403.1 hypothetical protein Bfra_006612 [Botrytis fragariae]
MATLLTDTPRHRELSYNRNSRSLTIDYDYSLRHIKSEGKTLECILTQYAAFTETAIVKIQFSEAWNIFRHNVPTFEHTHTINYGPLNQIVNQQRIADVVRALKGFRQLRNLEISLSLDIEDFPRIACVAPFFDLRGRCQQWSMRYKLGRHGNYISIGPGSPKPTSYQQQRNFTPTTPKDSEIVETIQDAQMASGITWHSELSYHHGTLTINYDYEDSDVKYHISQYALIAREIIFNICFPEPDNDNTGLRRVEQDLSEIIETLNDEFDLCRSDVMFWLREYDISQISCALEFRHLRGRTVFEYYVRGYCQDTVDMDSD